MIITILDAYSGQLYSFDADLITGPVNNLKSEIESKMSTVFRLIDFVDTVEDIPEKADEIGDVYIVRDDGSEWVWTNKNTWEKLGDYTQFYLKSKLYNKDELNSIFKNLAKQLGTPCFSLTTDTVFIADKEYYYKSNDLGLYIPVDTSTHIGESIPPNTYFEFTKSIGAQLTDIAEVANQSKNKIAEHTQCVKGVSATLPLDIMGVTSDALVDEDTLYYTKDEYGLYKDVTDTLTPGQPFPEGTTYYVVRPETYSTRDIVILLNNAVNLLNRITAAHK